MKAFEFESRLVFFVDGLDFDLLGVGDESPHHHPGAVAKGMHAEQLMRAAVQNVDQTLQFTLIQNHAHGNLPHVGQVQSAKLPESLDC